MAKKLKEKKLRGAPVSEKPYKMWTKTHAELVNRITKHQEAGCNSFREWFDRIRTKYGS